MALETLTPATFRAPSIMLSGEVGYRDPNEGFENLIRGSRVTMDDVLRRAPSNWYIEAQEAQDWA